MPSNASREPEPYLTTILKRTHDQAGTIKELRRRYGAALPEVVLPVAREPVGADEIDILFRTLTRIVDDASELNGAERWNGNWTAALEDSVRDAWAAELDGAIRNLRRVRRALGAPVKVCEQCGLRFTGRADARVCSDTCRVAAHRERQRVTAS